MSDEEIKEKSLASARACLEEKAPMEKAAIIHQHIGRREMTDMIIETIKSNPGTHSKSLKREVLVLLISLVHLYGYATICCINCLLEVFKIGLIFQSAGHAGVAIDQNLLCYKHKGKKMPAFFKNFFLGAGRRIYFAWQSTTQQGQPLASKRKAYARLCACPSVYPILVISRQISKLSQLFNVKFYSFWKTNFRMEKKIQN